MNSEPLTIAFAPVYQNPYQHLLATALQTHDIQVLRLGGMPGVVWLFNQRKNVRIIHLHWLSGLYMRHLLTPLRLATFVFRLVIAQRLGYRIVWTAHNILPHRRPIPRLHVWVRGLVMSRADAVIAHCQYGKDELLRRFPRLKPVHIVPIGSYAGVHAVTLSRDEARDMLGIDPDQFVYLHLGNIADYKGIDHFVAAFRRHASAADLALIAGRNRAPVLVSHLQSLAARDQRIRVFPGFIPEERMGVYLKAADVMVFAFREILTSSSVILGMSYGLPVIAPALGCLPELVSAEAGILYDPQDPAALSEALKRIKSLPAAQMGAMAQAITADLRWESIGLQTATIYWKCLAGDTT